MKQTAKPIDSTQPVAVEVLLYQDCVPVARCTAKKNDQDDSLWLEGEALTFLTHSPLFVEILCRSPHAANERRREAVVSGHEPGGVHLKLVSDGSDGTAMSDTHMTKTEK